MQSSQKINTQQQATPVRQDSLTGWDKMKQSNKDLNLEPDPEDNTYTHGSFSKQMENRQIQFTNFNTDQEDDQSKLQMVQISENI